MRCPKCHSLKSSVIDSRRAKMATQFIVVARVTNVVNVLPHMNGLRKKH